MKPLRNLLLGAGAFGLAMAFAVAADDAPKPPESPEIWVPSTELKVILSKNPSAVLLTREQYQTLMRDAGKTVVPGKEPPRRAVLTSARYTGELNGDVIDVHAEFTVNVLSDNWAEVPLRLGALALGDIKLDGDAAISADNGAANLVIRGKGEHKITAEFMLPVKKESGVSSLQLSLPRAGAGLFSFNVPVDTQVESSQPVNLRKNADSITVGVPVAAQNDVIVSWHSTGNAQQGAAIVFAENSYIYSLDETRVQADLGIVLNAALGSLPASLQIKIPAGSTPLQVVGNEVLKWTANNDVLTVDFVPGDRKTVGIRVLLESPVEIAPGDTQLPLPEVAGVRRSAGKFAVIGSSGVKIKEITAGEGPVQAEGIFDSSIEQDEHFVAGYGFAVQPPGLKVTVEKVATRFSADLDTLVQFKREAIFIERTLALRGEEGEIFESNFVMPDGEELISVQNADGSEPDWKADGAAVKIRLSEGLDSGQSRVFKITSRMEPPKWPDTDEIAVGDLKIPGAAKVNGYLALQEEQMFRLQTAGVEGLEKRDGRTTPVKGDFAWFRREAFQLHVKITRRAPEVQATLLAYALPVDGALDVNGQLAYDIRYSGVNKLRVKVPADSAEQFYFDGPQIAERNRDGDTWTIVLQKEVTGRYALKFHAMIPFDESKANFHVDVPDVQPLDVKQQEGTWAIEANTTTEISFVPTGMDELDPLHAPDLPDYQPRHHVIGVYAYLGGQHSLKLDGVKHEAAPILTAIADRLDLETVVSTSGAERHKAVFNIRTVGDQFLIVTLPQGSVVWSLAVNGQPLKPVAEKPDVVRVQLPATLDRTHDTAIQLVYETRRREWKGSGGYNLAAPRLDTRIPVLQSHWQVWLPDGFSYTAFDSNLRKEEAGDTAPLLFGPFQWLKNRVLFRPSAAAAVYTSHDVNNLLVEAQGFYDSGRYDLAYKRYDQVLSLDPGNAVARSGQETVLKAKEKYANMAYNETRASTNWSITKGWETPPRKYINREVVRIDASPNTNSSAYVQNKLDRIIIPSLKFDEATVRDAIEFLQRKSVELDTAEPDPSKRGVNIVANLEPAGTGEQPASGAEARVTLSLTNIPLAEALRYVCELSGLKYKVDSYAVTIAPLSEPTETLATKEYQLPPGFLSAPNQTDSRVVVTGAGALTFTGGLTATPTTPTSVPSKASAMDYLKNAGVQFPEGASATFDPATNKLIVRNTEENLDLVDQVAEALGPAGAAGASGNFDGYVNYGASINGTGSVAISGTAVGGNPINQPIFDTRKLDNPASPQANTQPGGPADSQVSVESKFVSVDKSNYKNQYFEYGLGTAGQKSAGLLPMIVDLEHTGREYSFEGYYAAEKVSFHYVNWWNEARRGWIWWIAGGLAFFAGADRRAWRRLVWGSLALTFIPACLAPSFTGMCNELLIGWISGFIIHQIATRLVFRRRVLEVAAV